MAKFLVLSLLRTRFDGDIVVFKNSPAPLFMVPRAGVREVIIDAGEPAAQEEFWDYAQSWKFRVRDLLDVRGYDKVLFLDADFLALDSIAPLFEGDWDLRAYAEPGTHAGMLYFNTFIAEDEPAWNGHEGVNGGALAVRAELYHEVMAAWEAIHSGPAPRPKYFADQAAITRLVIDTPLRKRMFTEDDVSMPLSYHPRAERYLASRLVHLAGTRDFNLKLRFMFGLYMSTFYFDRQASLLHILDM
jgi:hypothetical protein